ncbi:MAG: TetR/AcrR family transcriptional regulator [Clostridia bacterium]|nr:TetR/AcrR family transcriptional regulator [Clostridia bacterium]
MPFEKRRTSTRIQIIKLGAKLFVEEGYNKTSFSHLSRELNISLGNITFYFPTKEHLLAVLCNELCSFQRELMEKEVGEGYSSLLSYCLELTSMAAICEEDEVARDFFHSIYSSPLSLDIIRDNDTEKTREIFSEYRSDWTESKWIEAENLVSGIEYATIMTREERTPLPLQIEGCLDAILTLYGVPEELRRQKIQKVLAMDYRALGRRILGEFKEYVEKINEEALIQARARKKHNPDKKTRLN